MTKQQHKKALNCLKTINNLKLHKNYTLKAGVVRYEYKHQLIDLDGMTMIVAGSWEQFNSLKHTTDKIFLVISLLDQNNEDIKFSPFQLDEYINELKPKLSIA
jgi:hypothetical protein